MDTFTGNKHLDREILLNLPDKKLIQTCSLNTYLLRTVCDDNFFYNKLRLTYPDTLSLYNSKEYKNYKQFYLEMIIYIAKMKEDYGYSYVGGNPILQLEIFQASEYRGPSKKKKISPLRLLSNSAERGDLVLVKYAIAKGVDIHYNNEYALRAACAMGHLEMAKYLISLGANIYKYFEDVLKLASLNGHLEMVKYLVSLGADVHINNDIALQVAIKYGRRRVVEYLQSLN
jgi:ankyrin repeat protein